jgi:UDP:flavonoid glycosyltransferase YjiC (YdhE family)
MARILCVTSDVPATLYSGGELARRLARAGHSVTFAGFPSSRDTIEGVGLDFVSLAPSRYQDFLAADAKEGTLRRLRLLASRRQRAVESLSLDGLTPLLRRADPDLILIDAEMHEHIISLAARRLPMALLNSFVSIWRLPGLPPPHHLVRPGVGWKGSRVGIWLLWRALRLRKWIRARVHEVRRLGCDRLSLLRQLACASNFDFPRDTDNGQWPIPFTYSRLPVLSMHAQEFEFPHRPPARMHYLGPMLLEHRSDDRVTHSVRDELKKIFERRRGGKRALIYAGFGSFFSSDPEFLHRLMDAVAARSDWDLVISLGGRSTPAKLKPLADNIHVFSWVPQLDVLQQADVAVNHGGINTVDECVLFGVPMLVYCGFETDMGGTTSRVVHHGLGIAGDRRQDSPRLIGERLNRLLLEPNFRDNVTRFQTLYAKYAENRVAERTIESLLDSHQTRAET